MADPVFITPVSDPVLHARLTSMWEAEHRPGWVILGNKTYQAVQRAQEGWCFVERSNQSYYESVSF